MNKIIFVCLGNICRSPSAEGVMQSVINKRGLEDQFYIDSAGTYGGHAGQRADSRMRKHAERRNYNLTSISRPLEYSDFKDFDLIIGMDNENMRDIHAMDRKSQFGHKIFKMTDFCKTCNDDVVPDPYYGGSAGFEHVLDILEDACEGLLDDIINGTIAK